MKYIRNLDKKNVTNPECKRNASFIPETYRLNDEDDCKHFFETFKTKEYEQQFKKYGPQYIMKTNQHRGEGITVLFKKEADELLTEYDHGNNCGNISKQIIA
jgi:tubulin polyglutamylase TTLL1